MLTLRRMPDPPDTPAQRRLLATRTWVAWLPWALHYTLRIETLAVAVLLAAGLWFGSLGPFGLFLFICFLGGATHYLFAVLERSVHGFADPPSLTGADLLAFDPRAAKLFVLVAIAIAFDLFVQREAPAVLWWWRALTVLLAPGVTVLLALEGSVVHALAPRNLLPFATRAGPGYLLLVLLLALALFGQAIVPATPGSQGDAEGLIGRTAQFGVFPLVLASLLLGILVAHLLGIIVYLRREALGIEAQVDQPADGAADQVRMVRAVNDLFARLDRMVDKEEHEAAERLLLTAPLSGTDDLTELDLLFEEARRRKRNYLVIAAGQRYIEALVGAGQPLAAAHAARHCLDRYPRFEPFHPAQLVRMAEATLVAGEHALFERLVADFDARHPAAAERSEVALLRARDRAERVGDEAGALAILQAAPIHPDARFEARRRAYQQALERIIAAPRRP